MSYYAIDSGTVGGMMQYLGNCKAGIAASRRRSFHCVPLCDGSSALFMSKTGKTLR